jgi:CRISPR-associated protein Csm1
MTELYKQKLQKAFEPITTLNNPTGYLLKGDVSGIQEFIFNVASKGAAKSLKARSYYVQVVAELCEQYCLSQLKDSKSFYNGGGNFFIELPDNGMDIEQLQKLQTEIDKELQHDEIYISLSWIKVSEFGDFGKAWDALSKEANQKKLSKFKTNYDLLFTPFLQQNQKDKQNIRWQKVVEKIKNDLTYTSLNGLFKEVCNAFVKENEMQTSLFSLNNPITNYKSKIVNKLPFWKEYGEKLNDYKKYRTKNYGSDEQNLNDNNIIDFDGFGDFAAYRTGTNKIAVLKLDVDNLGKVFKELVHSKESGKAISESFGWFFDDYLFQLWKKEFDHYRTGKEEKETYSTSIYPVFAGGDDCFIIGAWDAVLQFAKKLNETFTDFVSLAQSEINKKDKDNALKLTLSAGIIIVDPKHPTISISELAEHELKEAKKRDGKNCISIFGEVFSWEEYNEILNLNNTLITEIKLNDLNRSFLDKIRQSAKGFGALQKNALQGKLDMQKIWRLKYYLGRKESDSFKEVEKKLFEPYYNALLKAMTENKETNPALFPVAARLTELHTRKILSYIDGDFIKAPKEAPKESSYRKPTKEEEIINKEKKEQAAKRKDERSKYTVSEFANICWKYYSNEESIERTKIILNHSKQNEADIIKQTDEMVQKEWSAIKTSQLRKVFEKVKQVKPEDIKNIQRVRPLMVYMAARQDNKQTMGLVQFLKEIIEQIETVEQLANFQAYFEAIVSFHKYYHGHKSN